jgi:hypothetical protein
VPTLNLGSQPTLNKEISFLGKGKGEYFDFRRNEKNRISGKSVKNRPLFLYLSPVSTKGDRPYISLQLIRFNPIARAVGAYQRLPQATAVEITLRVYAPT